MFQVMEDLEAIYSGEAANNEYNAEEIALDHASANAVQACLAFRDVDQNHVIDSFDDTVLNAIFTDGDFSVEGLGDLTEDERNDLVYNIGQMLITSNESIGYIVSSINAVDTENLDEVLSEVYEYLEDQYTGGENWVDWSTYEWPEEEEEG